MHTKDMIRLLKNSLTSKTVCFYGVLFFLVLLFISSSSVFAQGTLDKGLTIISGLILDMGSYLIAGGSIIFTYVVEYTIFDFGKFWDSDSATLNTLESFWKILRDVGNLIIALLFLYTAFLTLVGNFVFRGRILVFLLLAALLINFSAFITLALFDLSNLIFATFYFILNPPVQDAFFIESFFKDLLFQEGGNSIVPGGFLIFASLTLFVTSFFIFAGLFYFSLILAERFVIALLLVLSSPLAVIGFMLSLSGSADNSFSTLLTAFYDKWKTRLQYTFLTPITLIFGLTFIFAIFTSIVEPIENMARAGGGLTNEGSQFALLAQIVVASVVLIIGIFYTARIARSISIPLPKDSQGKARSLNIGRTRLSQLASPVVGLLRNTALRNTRFGRFKDKPEEPTGFRGKIQNIRRGASAMLAGDLSTYRTDEEERISKRAGLRSRAVESQEKGQEMRERRRKREQSLRNLEQTVRSASKLPATDRLTAAKRSDLTDKLARKLLGSDSTLLSSLVANKALSAGQLIDFSAEAESNGDVKALLASISNPKISRDRLQEIADAPHPNLSDSDRNKVKVAALDAIVKGGGATSDVSSDEKKVLLKNTLTSLSEALTSGNTLSLRAGLKDLESLSNEKDDSVLSSIASLELPDSALRNTEFSESWDKIFDTITKEGKPAIVSALLRRSDLTESQLSSIMENPNVTGRLSQIAERKLRERTGVNTEERQDRTPNQNQASIRESGDENSSDKESSQTQKDSPQERTGVNTEERQDRTPNQNQASERESGGENSSDKESSQTQKDSPQ